MAATSPLWCFSFLICFTVPPAASREVVSQADLRDSAQLIYAGIRLRDVAAFGPGNWLLESLLWNCAGHLHQCRDPAVKAWVYWNVGVLLKKTEQSDWHGCHYCHFIREASFVCPRSKDGCDPDLIRSAKALDMEFGGKCSCEASALENVRVGHCAKCMDIFRGLPEESRWSQFIDGRDHDRGPKAYDLKPSEIDNVTLFVSGPASHGSWLDYWFRAYSYLIHTCAVQLSVPLMIALFIPLYLGESQDALVYGSSQQQEHLWRNRPLGTHFVVAGQESPGMGIDALMTVGDPAQMLYKLEEVVEAYNEHVESTDDGSAQALDAIVMFARRLHFLHPFQDGNARMVSLLLDRELALHGFNPVSMFNNLPHFVMVNTVKAYQTAITEGMEAWRLVRDVGKSPWLDAVYVGKHKKALPNRYSPKRRWVHKELNVEAANMTRFYA